MDPLSADWRTPAPDTNAAVQDGDNINNFVEVLGDPTSAAARQRLIAEDGSMTVDERATMLRIINGLPE